MAIAWFETSTRMEKVSQAIVVVGLIDAGLQMMLAIGLKEDDSTVLAWPTCTAGWWVGRHVRNILVKVPYSKALFGEVDVIFHGIPGLDEKIFLLGRETSVDSIHPTPGVR